MAEKTIWTGHPSQIVNLGWFLFMGIIALVLLFEFFPFALIPILVIVWQWLQVKFTQYELTTERLKTKKGVLNRRIDELELYRVKDYSMEEPLSLRIFGKANVILETSDRTDPRVLLHAINNGEALRNLIRTQVEECRAKKGVREMDFAQ